MLETNLGGVNIPALVVLTIATQLQTIVNPDVRTLPYLSGLKLAHPVNPSCRFDISILIGVDHHWEIVGNHIVRGNGPTAMQSKLGYLLSEPLPQQSQSTIAGVLHAYISQEFPECPYATSTMLGLSTSPLVSQQNSVQPSESFMELLSMQSHIMKQ